MTPTIRRVYFLMDLPLDKYSVKGYAEKHATQFSVTHITTASDAIRLVEEEGFGNVDAIALHKDIGDREPPELRAYYWERGMDIYEYIIGGARKQNPNIVAGVISGEFPNGNRSVIKAQADFYMNRAFAGMDENGWNDAFLTHRLLAEPNKNLWGKAVNCLPKFDDLSSLFSHCMTDPEEVKQVMQFMAESGNYQDKEGYGPYGDFLHEVVSRAQSAFVQQRNPDLKLHDLTNLYQRVQLDWLKRKFDIGLEGRPPQSRK